MKILHCCNWFRFFPKPLLDLTEGHKGKGRKRLGAAEARGPSSRALRGLNPESMPPSICEIGRGSRAMILGDLYNSESISRSERIHKSRPKVKKLQWSMGLVGTFSSSPVTGVRKARLTPILLLRIKLLIHPRKSGPIHKAGRSKASVCTECAGDSNLTHSLRQESWISLVASG